MSIIKSFLSMALSASLLISAQAANVSDFSGLDKYVGSSSSVAPASYNYLSDGSQYLQLIENGTKIVKIDTKTGNVLETLMDVNNTREGKISRIEGYTLSPEATKILVYTQRRNIYRNSFDAVYYVYEIRTRLLKPLSTEHARQQAPLFSPDGRMVAFVADNNVQLKKLDYGTEMPVTTDGATNKIINGVPDWTYQEEFATTASMTWAPDNLTLCFLKYNETDVPLFSFELYEGSCNPMKQYALYPGQFTYKYPVAGQNNSKVTLHSYDVETRKTKEIQLPDSRIEYIPRISYAYSPDRLVVTTLNRGQNRMEMYLVNPKSTGVKSLLVEEYTAWLSPTTYENIHFYPTFFVITSSRSGYDHLYRYSYSGALEQQITSGDYDVTAYYGYDSRRDCHYYQSASSGAINRVVSRIDKKGKIVDLSPTEGMASAVFSPDMAFYTLTHSTALTPPVYTLHNASSDKAIKTLEDNAAFASRYADAPKKEFFTMTSDGVTLNGYMIKPAGFSASKRYPVVMFQYSGPGSQQVLNQWGMNWTYYFASQGYIIMCVDGRGTGGRGRAFMDVVYKQLGHYESIDQVNAAKYAATLPYVDANRIGIHGWSYGGYETLMACSQPNAPYAAAVSVAPVTDWRYYDTIYAERYMLTPQENEDGYANSTPINMIKNVKCPVLIMTGTADDNVHYFNTIQYVSALEAAGTWCDMLVFPNMDHSINGCNSRQVVYARMLDYFNKNMK